MASKVPSNSKHSVILCYSKKENFFDFKQENNDSRNSNQTLNCLDHGCLSGRGRHWEQGHLRFIFFTAADFGKLLSLP